MSEEWRAQPDDEADELWLGSFCVSKGGVKRALERQGLHVIDVKQRARLEALENPTLEAAITLGEQLADSALLAITQRDALAAAVRQVVELLEHGIHRRTFLDEVKAWRELPVVVAARKQAP